MHIYYIQNDSLKISARNGGSSSLKGTNFVLLVDSLFLIVQNLQRLSIVLLDT